MNSRVGNGYDIHPFGDAGTLVLGGVTIEGAPRLVGHSDGDAVAHAVADAIAGPAGLPDLGAMFPASDDQWRDANSIALLTDVAGRLAKAGWWIANVDVVIAAERPALALHIDAMVANVGAALVRAHKPMGTGIHVSIAAKRGEGLDAIGRGEGVAAWAVALLVSA